MKKTVYIFTILLTAILVPIGNKLYVSAAEPVSKDIVFEITQDYEACSFTITTQMQGNFTVELGMANSNQTYSAVIEDSNTCNISVEDVRAGKWSVTVTEIVPEDYEAQAPEESEAEEGSAQEIEEAPRTADDVIGKIQVQAKAIDKTAFSIGNVDVARDIVGLQRYFKDDAIVVEWTDTSCGNVNISVIDTYTNQILDKTTVPGRYYEFVLPELVSEITIDIVPATSSNITGANSRYTLAVLNQPDAVVTYEDREYTNEDTVPVYVHLNEAYSLLFMVNGTEVKTTGMLAAGEYTYTIPVSEGNNEILTYIVDTEHNMRSTPHAVIRDSIKPALTLDMEYDKMTTYDDTIIVTGTIKDYDTFMINETVPVVAGDGSFKAEYILRDGENVLNIRATDIAGNETLYSATVTKLIKETPRILDYAWPVGVILVLIVGLVIKFFSNKRVKGSENRKPAQDKTVGEKRRREKKSTKEELTRKNIAIFILIGVACLVGASLFFGHVLIGGRIMSPSMEPTLQVGDYTINNGLAYVGHEPQRGDIIIFRHEGTDITEGKTCVKRVIGLPGDSLVFVDGYLYLNGELVYESYLPENMETNSFKDFDQVPDGCYFVMGDNRENSSDSRFWNNPYVAKNEIRGKLMSVIPLSRLSETVKSFF